MAFPHQPNPATATLSRAFSEAAFFIAKYFSWIWFPVTRACLINGTLKERDFDAAEKIVLRGVILSAAKDLLFFAC
jgi:hypothetical protein